MAEHLYASFEIRRDEMRPSPSGRTETRRIFKRHDGQERVRWNGCWYLLQIDPATDSYFIVLGKAVEIAK